MKSYVERLTENMRRAGVVRNTFLDNYSKYYHVVPANSQDPLGPKKLIQGTVAYQSCVLLLRRPNSGRRVVAMFKLSSGILLTKQVLVMSKEFS